MSGLGWTYMAVYLGQAVKVGPVCVVGPVSELRHWIGVTLSPRLLATTTGGYGGKWGLVSCPVCNSNKAVVCH